MLRQFHLRNSVPQLTPSIMDAFTQQLQSYMVIFTQNYLMSSESLNVNQLIDIFAFDVETKHGQQSHRWGNISNNVY